MSEFTFELPTDLLTAVVADKAVAVTTAEDKDEVLQNLHTLLNDLAAFPTLLSSEFDMNARLHTVLTLYWDTKMRCRMALGPDRIAELKAAAAAIDASEEDDNHDFQEMARAALGIPEPTNMGIGEIIQDLCLEAAVLDFIAAKL